MGSAFVLTGLIPARAGKTVIQFAICLLNRAHPRACGENNDGILETAVRKGSSPRVRGKPFEIDADDEEGRLIPARAGKTLEQRTLA